MKTWMKFNQLKRILKSYPGVIVAFSGGVDSSLLLRIAKDVLKEKVVAVTATSLLYPKSEIIWAKKVAKKIGCQLTIIKSNELKSAKFLANSRKRCFYCKMELFGQLKKTAEKFGYVVVEASNKSDLDDYRPGLLAAKKLGVKSPLIEAGIEKNEIRIWAKRLRLPNWDKPSMACLASRIPYGRNIDRRTISRVDCAEAYLRRLKFSQVRVRDHLPVARIEVLNSEFEKIFKYRTKIIKYLKKIGYKHIALDLAGYQTGSMN